MSFSFSHSNAGSESADIQSDDSYTSADSDPALLREKLKLIINACEEYDDQAVEAILAELKENQWSKETKGILDKIAEYILHSEFEAAAESASVDWKFKRNFFLDADGDIDGI